MNIPVRCLLCLPPFLAPSLLTGHCYPNVPGVLDDRKLDVPNDAWLMHRSAEYSSYSIQFDKLLHHHHIDNRGLNARWCLTPLLLSLPTAAYLGQRGLSPLTPAGLPHTTAHCHLNVISCLTAVNPWFPRASFASLPLQRLVMCHHNPLITPYR